MKDHPLRVGRERREALRRRNLSSAVCPPSSVIDMNAARRRQLEHDDALALKLAAGGAITHIAEPQAHVFARRANRQWWAAFAAGAAFAAAAFAAAAFAAVLWWIAP